jgi:orotate phosphoribosyltransferase
VQQVERDWGLEVISVVSLDDIIAWVEGNPAMAPHRESLERYRERYGVS